MKIAQIAPLTESVPPRCYGGTERIVAYLTNELVRAGHEVTLFASGDSRTLAELVSCSDIALRQKRIVSDPNPHHVIMLEKVRKRADDFDVVHFHIDWLHLPLVREFSVATLTTLHGRLDRLELKALYFAFSDLPFVSVSDHQRQPLRNINWAGTVYHGLPRDLLPFKPQATGGYLAFLGRISPEKRPDRAIQIAARAGMPLKMAAKIDKVDQAYWEDMIAPMVKQNSSMEFVGEITEHEKADFLGDALALLFPIDWPEPFGLVLIESMACGTPVIAYRNGAVPEVIASGISGFVVESMDGAVDAVRRLEGIERARVRACFESRFTAERMANDYLTIYSRLTGIDHPPGPSIRSISGNGASIANGPVSERERL